MLERRLDGLEGRVRLGEIAEVNVEVGRGNDDKVFLYIQRVDALVERQRGGRVARSLADVPELDGPVPRPGDDHLSGRPHDVGEADAAHWSVVRADDLLLRRRHIHDVDFLVGSACHDRVSILGSFPVSRR